MNTHNIKKPMLHSLLTATLCIGLTACGGAPKKLASLESARNAYNSAAAKELVTRYAPTELEAARTALQQAEKHWKDEGKGAGSEHFAYVANQRVKIAELVANKKSNDLQLEAVKLDQQRIDLDMRAHQVDSKHQQTLALQQQLADMEATITARGIVATLSDVLFDTAEATLKESASMNIDKIAHFMNSYPDRTALVEGHTDNTGTDDFNLDLSRERAFSVQTALIERGIDASRISTRSLGESVPIASNNTTDGRQKNRRVEIIFPDDQSVVSQDLE